jgi:hypothetical protein
MAVTTLSSPSPISSKFVMSDRIPSGLELWNEEWAEEDFEDFDPDKSGGEFGGLIVLVISSPATPKAKVERAKFVVEMQLESRRCCRLCDIERNSRGFPIDLRHQLKQLGSPSVAGASGPD